jgi:hypothetical protein
MRFVRAIVAAVIVAAFLTIPATAQSTANYKFYLWSDGNGNGVFDSFGADKCIGGGQTVNVFKYGTGFQPWFRITFSRPTFVVTNNSLYTNCQFQSSNVYGLVPGAQYYMSWPGPATWFTTPTTGLNFTYGQGHRIYPTSGE